jgi:hypothetical protein
MDLADELRKLEELHRARSLTDEEFARAKAAVLADSGTPPAGALGEQLAELRRENEVARLDREWEQERRQYLVAGRYGRSYEPTPGMSILSGVLVVGFGVLWTAMTAGLMGGPGGGFGFFPLFGVVFIVVGLAVSVASYGKAVRYRQAYEAYQERRQQLLSGDG